MWGCVGGATRNLKEKRRSWEAKMGVKKISSMGVGLSNAWYELVEKMSMRSSLVVNVTMERGCR